MTKSPDQATAILFESVGAPLQSVAATLPELHPGEVLVAISATTLCGSDLHTYHGRRETATPAILGHEIIGRIAALSEQEPARAYDGSRLKVGDRVTWSLCVHCGDCFFCQRDLPQKCEQLLKYGHQSFVLHPWCGGLASHIILRRHSSLFKIPDALTDAVACPANCATATVAAALRRVDSVIGGNVVILGAGMLGLTAAAMVKEAGARKAILIDRDQARLDRALKFGATDLVHTDQLSEPLDSTIKEMTEGRGADVVLELTGATNLVQEGLRLLRVGGQLILVGSVFPTTSAEMNPEQIVRKMISIQGVHNYAPEDLGTALKFLSAHTNSYPFAGLVEETFSLSDSTEAFAFASTGQAFRVMIKVANDE
ncbi:D-arabitol-phosphate dehydrogenase [Polystyrenella longa]|uniref:alcohol dehydrogenase n=1 Tax=Polystyrenella longa TaxID=2528007 RepID=A0A518CJR3_9PLAN|nr:zinc-binding dehydrogenase [Polystyrenella longa]QDU79462.1 D-arabitol-phosphate dehydrogenase [Polystyrenella longa]